MAELKIKKGDKEVFHYETKENKNKGKRFYRHYGLSRFEFNLLWTGLWFVFMAVLCAMFETMSPLWLLIFWLMGYKW
jgi:hypothetical protein